MQLTSISLPPGGGPGFVTAFPGGSGGGACGEPMAILSFASAGDMKYGHPASAANRERFLFRAGLEPADVLGLDLVHSRTVLFPARGEDPADLARGSEGADGMILRDRFAVARDAGPRAASVTVADCMPIWLFDRDSGAYGILHSGWRGTGILAVALRSLTERYRSRPASIALVLGPAIGVCCYEVPEERARRFSAEFGPGSVRRRGSSSFLDLRTANVSIAEAFGVGHVLSIESCTSCDERLGSYRRQGGAAFTRMLAVCGFSPREAGILGGGPE